MATGGNSGPPFPARIAGQRYKVANIGNPTEKKDELTLEYFYDQEEADDVTFNLLEAESQKGVFGRFLVVRSGATKTPHVLHTSSFIPAAECRVEVKKEGKQKGYYKVCLKKLKASAEVGKYFKPQTPPSSSDEDKS